MDPMTKMYMYNHWLEDINEQVELAKNHGYLIGSFMNPEAVKQLMDGPTYKSTDEDFELANQWVTETNKLAEQEAEVQVRRKRRRKIVNNSI